MNFGFYQPIFYGLLCLLGIAYPTGGSTLTVTPSNEVAVNQRVTLLCEFDSNPVVAQFNKVPQTNPFCQLAEKGGACMTTDCSIGYNLSCPSNTRYSIQVTVTQSWNGETVFCQGAAINEPSNNITFRVTVPVTSVDLLPDQPISVIAEQLMNLTCTTSACNPSANIQWFMSSENITSHSSSKITNDGGFFRTVSSLNFAVKKQDNQKQVFCRASNIPGNNVTSRKQTLHVLYKPEVKSSPSSPYRVEEEHTATLVCTVTAANPNTGITWRWIKTDSPSTVLHNGPSYNISNIQRGRSGSYNCTATNTVGTSEAATIYVDVLYQPEVKSSPSSPYRVEEEHTATLVCTVTAANPNTGITWIWIKTDSPSTVLHTGPSYTISNIQRGRSGSYICTATNTVGTSEPAMTVIDVLYKPEVKSSPSSPYRVEEEHTATLVCTVTAANPNTGFTWIWIKTDSPSIVLHNGPSYNISNIQRGRSGSYNCTATNTVGTSEPATTVIDVLYKPKIGENAVAIVNESERVVLTRNISSNPLSNVYWYDGEELLKNETSVNTTYILLKEAKCTDTKNFTLVASNAKQWNATSLVELIVNCKPRSDDDNFTLGVSDDTLLAFSTTVIAYPKPSYAILFENRTNNPGIVDSLTENGVNNFTVRFNKSTVGQSDYGTYRLYINNTFGGTTIYVNVIPQRSPDSPQIEEIKCNVRSAKVFWKSPFNGGDSQTFQALAINNQQEVSQSENITDSGENLIHGTQLGNLQPSTQYVFYVRAQNRHGNTSSEKRECTTLKDLQDGMALLIGGASAGGIILAVIVIVVLLLIRRYKKHEDGMKENILYVSAGPHLEDTKKSELPIYAAVTKSKPESNDESNVYADVKKGNKKNSATACKDAKPKKGLCKKDVKPKQKTGKKPKNKQEVAETDVYENSENIAMTSNADNLYSNSEHDARMNLDQRGYKNNEGLLYIEVQFDAKKEKGNQIIHGEEEKTDYATVEFPNPTVSKETDSPGNM
uniref:Neural cell adhesion molecule 1-like isoform X2 n=1 Tax=Crassostrea virginica TaxID=6565 RepID=A0A8B8D7F3_CRAVI|nr:neural cell adhesion molecule 1-like isoform X2 [Crassostrea virginica]